MCVSTLSSIPHNCFDRNISISTFKYLVQACFCYSSFSVLTRFFDSILSFMEICSEITEIQYPFKILHQFLFNCIFKIGDKSMIKSRNRDTIHQLISGNKEGRDLDETGKTDGFFLEEVEGLRFQSFSFQLSTVPQPTGIPGALVPHPPSLTHL